MFGLNIALPLIKYVTLGKSFDLPMPWFSHLEYSDMNIKEDSKCSIHVHCLYYYYYCSHALTSFIPHNNTYKVSIILPRRFYKREN